MPETLGQAYVQILPTTEGIQGQMTELLGGPAQEAGGKAGGDWTSGFSKALKIGRATVAAVGAVGVATSKALLDGASQTAAYGDNIDKMSQKLGISAQAYQEWDAILQHSGASIDSMQSSMRTLQVAAETGKDAFERLGMSQEDVAAMTPEELFGATITALQGVESETERTYLATQLLGRGGTELGALLNTSAEDTEAMRQRVHELGGVMSDDAVKAAARYQDSLQDMQTSFSGLSRGLTAEFMPSIATVMDGLAEVFSGNGDAGIAMVSEGVDELVSNISDKLPQFIDLAVQILESLASAIIDNLPKLLESSGEIIGQIIAGIVQALPTLISNVPQIIAAIVKGLVSAWPEIRSAGRDAIDQLWQGIQELASNAWEWGKDLMQNFIQGILDKFQHLRETVQNAAKTVKDFLGFSEPEKGPLSNFHTYAPDMMALYAQGIRENTPMLQRQVEQSFDFRSVIRADAVLPQAPTAAAAPAQRQTQARPVVIPLYLDRTELGRVVLDLYNTESARLGLKLTGGATA